MACWICGCADWCFADWAYVRMAGRVDECLARFISGMLGENGAVLCFDGSLGG